MPRFLPLALAVAALAAAAPAAEASGLRKAHPVDISGVHGDPHLADPFAKQHVPPQLRAWSRSVGKNGIHAADHWSGMDVKEEQFEDQHGHVLTFATDNKSVDLLPYANLLASTYHYDEIERVHVFVTSSAKLTSICGSDAAACYAPDQDRAGTGLMIISYEDSDITHAVIHEYGHHIDNNTYNLERVSKCTLDGDGSRRWFFERQMQDNILDRLTCDPKADWGQLLPEVYAEDYAQMVGIPRSEYHPAIQVPPPTTREKAALRADIDKPFGPSSQKVKGRSNASRTAVFRAKISVPVFAKLRSARGVKSVSLRGCSLRGADGVFKGNCRMVVKTKRPRQPFSFNLVLY